MGVFTPRSMLAAMALVTGLSGCGAWDQPSHALQGVEDGVVDTAHTNVVGIVVLGSRSVTTCTGSLIASTLVLTARHCVSPVAEGAVVCADLASRGVAHAATRTQETHPAAAFLVTTEAMIPMRTGFTTVAEVLTPPGSTGVSLCGNDIALLLLSAPLAATPVLPRLDQPPIARERFTAIGYGATSAEGAGTGQRRARDGLRVLSVGRALEGGAVVRDEREWFGDKGVCLGDSGGPALDGRGEVFGVLSRGVSSGCDSPIYTRLDSFGDWIRAQTSRAAALGGYAAPSWVTEARPHAGGPEAPVSPRSGAPPAAEDPGCDAAPGGGRRAGRGLGLSLITALAVVGARRRGRRHDVLARG